MNVIPNSPGRRDAAVLLHPQTDWQTHLESGAFVLSKGDGVYVYDENGKQYIEGLAGLWCVSLGFSEERLVQAAMRQMRKLPYYHIYTSKSHDPAIELAERLLKIMPVPMSKVFFANSGSEANDTVVRLVWYFNNARGKPKKKKFIGRQKAFHGSTVAAGSLTGLPHLQRDFDLPLSGFLHAETPHHYRNGRSGESEEAYAERLARDLEALIVGQGGAEQCAAFIAEPIMGAGGVIVPPKGYFERVQQVLKKYDMLMVADEVICGFGRTGAMFGCETYGIRPDILTCAKALSSSYLPISAVAISQPVYEVLAANTHKHGMFGHGFTYSAHPVAAAVAVETLKIYEETDIVGRVRKVAPHFQAKLRSFAAHPLVGETRGVGLIGAAELVEDKATKKPFAPERKVGAYLAKRAEEHGLILRAMGDSIGFCPPLIVQEPQIDELFARFAKALDDTAAWLKDNGWKAAA
jgi:4-aminobutyrate---pyruvate transaminase